MSEDGGSSWAVALAGFGKSYLTGWTGGRVHAVREINLRLAPGQVLGLLGPNGSGKSTTLKALAGLIRPTTGECRVFGRIAADHRARALIGYLPESPRFSPHLTGRSFLAYCAGLSSLAPAAIAGRVEEVLRWTGLSDAADRPARTYSKGMAQRLGLAQAVLHDPPLVLLDEPAAGLDPAGRLELRRILRELAARGRTIVFSSHLLGEAGGWCDRLAILGGGRLLAEGTRAELLGASAGPEPMPSPLERLYLEKFHGHG